MKLEQINAWTEAQAREAFSRCCGSIRWSGRMTEARPFASEAALLTTAERIWWNLAETDWLEAFAAHPRIGDLESLRAKFATTAAWASHEQSGTQGASGEVLENLAIGNRHYEERFGFIFIVCATGKSAAEMLALLEERLPNDRPAELRIAAGEQMLITQLRLQRIAS
jgi:2-oxo-4-hydroxy-4-carboxy-5-ureidoimidazoline decarboxylase